MNVSAPNRAFSARAGRAEAVVDPLFAGRPAEELEFLPAALEIIRTPCSPLPRVAALSLTGLVALALAWAILGKVDVVTDAPGRLVPVGGGKVVQPLEAGQITAILVHDGQEVHRGDVLIKLEPAEPDADRDRLRAELASSELDVARLQTVALRQAFKAPDRSDPSSADVLRKEALAELSANAAAAGRLDQEIAQHQAEIESVHADIRRQEVLLPLAQQRLQVFTELREKGFGQKLMELEAQEKTQEITQGIVIGRTKIPEIQAQLAAARREKTRIISDAEHTSLGGLADALTKTASLKEELRKAELRVASKTIVAPADGTVQELSVHTIGGVVSPGEMLMRIAPSGARLEVEARFANRDVGFLKLGQPAEIKVDSFPFTQYGVLHGKLIGISRDSVVAPPGEADPRNAAAEPAQYYLARLTIPRDSLSVDGVAVQLRPGMTVAAEVNTGRRRIIQFILSPIKKTLSEAGRER
jgi:hemolysin D